MKTTQKVGVYCDRTQSLVVAEVGSSLVTSAFDWFLPKSSANKPCKLGQLAGAFN